MKEIFDYEGDFERKKIENHLKGSRFIAHFESRLVE